MWHFYMTKLKWWKSICAEVSLRLLMSTLPPVSSPLSVGAIFGEGSVVGSSHSGSLCKLAEQTSRKVL